MSSCLPGSADSIIFSSSSSFSHSSIRRSGEAAQAAADHVDVTFGLDQPEETPVFQRQLRCAVACGYGVLPAAVRK